MKKSAKAIFFSFIAAIVVGVMLYHSYFTGYSQKIKCRNNVRTLQFVCFTFANEHHGQFPNVWAETIKYSAGVVDIFKCPSTDTICGAYSNAGHWADYKLISGRTVKDEASNILVYEPLSNHGGTGGHVLFVNGNVKWCSDEEYQQMGLKQR